MAEPEPDQQRNQIEWNIWFQWVTVTALGWLLGWMLLGEVGIGAALGLTQWLVLRREVSDTRAGWWIIVSAVAFTGLAGGMVFAGVVGRAVTGLVLDLLLRYPRLDSRDAL